MPRTGTPKESRSFISTFRTLLIGLVVTLLVLGFAFTVMALGKADGSGPPKPVDALADSTDACVTCHRDGTPGIVEQFSHSTMAAAKVTCRNCHEVTQDHAGSVAHQGTWVLPSPTPTMCGVCHSEQVDQFYQSRHSTPAYAAIAGVTEFSDAQKAMYKAIPEGSYDPDKTRHALYAIEGTDMTQFACKTCHEIGLPQADGSVGKCQKCHLRHEFKIEQVRKPETCNNCHIGPDHPQWEIYTESPHGVGYATSGDTYNWTAKAGTLTVHDFPSPNCATCHMSGFGSAPTTHDVGDRLTWYLFAPKSDRRPSWQDNQTRMQDVCRECHNEQWVKNFYTKADALVLETNAWVQESDDIAKALKAAGQMNDKPFDEPIDFIYFDLWHDYGRTAKFGAWMQGPDYTQWHGAYEMLKKVNEMRDFAREKLGPNGYPLTSAPVTTSTVVPEPVK
jgi:hydroxylamine dehydrogenase